MKQPGPLCSPTHLEASKSSPAGSTTRFSLTTSLQAPNACPHQECTRSALWAGPSFQGKRPSTEHARLTNHAVRSATWLAMLWRPFSRDRSLRLLTGAGRQCASGAPSHRLAPWFRDALGAPKQLHKCPPTVTGMHASMQAHLVLSLMPQRFSLWLPISRSSSPDALPFFCRASCRCGFWACI
jgi:hypothetical protein